MNKSHLKRQKWLYSSILQASDFLSYSFDHYFSGFRSYVWLGAGILGLGLSLMPAPVRADTFPNVYNNPLYGTATLSSGFTPDPFRVSVSPGGNTDVSQFNLGSDCRGYIAAEQPDFRLSYQASSFSSLPLTFAVTSSADTTLIINSPSNQWFCSDDVNGLLNPSVTFNAPQSGQYDIWVGLFGTTAPAELQVTEMVGSPPTTYTSVNFCNQTSNPVYAAYTAYEQNSGWRSNGWYRIEAQRCQDISLGREYTGSVYVYGEYNQGQLYWGTGDSSFCVNRTDSFNIPYSDQANCSGSNYKRIPMTLLSVRPGQNTWTMSPGNPPHINPAPNPNPNPSPNSRQTTGGKPSGASSPSSESCLVTVGGVCVLEL